MNTYLDSTPPDSEDYHSVQSTDLNDGLDMEPEFEPDFDSLIDLDAAGEVFSLEETAYAAVGESGGFTMDMGWMKGMKDDGLVMDTSMVTAAD